MNCETCERDKKNTLLDGRRVCSWCEEYRHECEANSILHFPTLAARRAMLYGGFVNGQKVPGVLKMRGEAEVRRLEKTMMALWRQSKQQA